MILGKKSGTDWVLPKIIGSGRVSGTRQALLGTAKKEGTLVSQRTLQSQLRNSDEEQAGVYTVNCVNSVSDTNIVVSHINQGKRFVQAFNFL